MKTKILLILIISGLISEVNQMLAQSPVTIYTPKNSPLYEHTRPELLDSLDKENMSEEVESTYPQATEINPPSSTTTFNCHAYAWRISEGGSTCTIARYYGDTDESAYWTDYSYIETTEPYASKISYLSDDHSAIQTSTQGTYRSKWGDYPIMQHAYNYGPYDYSSRKYYRLNPIINGSTSLMCDNNQRTFSSDVSISGSTYTWSRATSLLDYVSGSGTTSYIVEANSGSGKAYVGLQITTPSGEVATASNKSVWVGIPDLDYISGPESGEINNIYNYDAYPAYDILSGASYYWNLQPMNNNYLYSSYDHAEIHFYDADAYQVIAQATNSCGSTNNAVLDISITGLYLLNPNPASEEVTITVKENELLKADRIFSISVFNMYGVQQNNYTRSGKSFTIPVNNLPDGNYIVRINDGKKTVAKRLVVKH